MEGATVIYVASDGYLAGLIAISDPVNTTPDALKALRQAGIRIIMLTGDNQLTAEAVARKLGIDEVEAGVLPDGKKSSDNPTESVWSCGCDGGGRCK